MPKHALFCVSIMLFAFLGAACGGLSSEPEIIATFAPTPTALSPTEIAQLIAEPDLEAGRAIFVQHCTACHGETGRGDGRLVANGQIPTIPDFSNPATLSVHLPQDIFTVITEGRMDKLMPPWRGALSESQRWAVAMYVYSLREDSAPDVAQNAPPVSAAPAQPVPAQAVGTVSGTVINATAGGSVPQDMSIALQILDANFQEVGFVLTQPTNGRYAFADVLIRADYQYLVTALYNAHVFSSQQVAGDPAVPALDLPVTIYEATDDPAVMTINLLVTRIEKHQNDLMLTQVISFRNQSDRMFIRDEGADAPESIRLALPPGAQVLNESELLSCCTVQNGILLSAQPILPDSDVMLRVVYTLPYNSGGTVIEYPIGYPMTNQIELLLTPSTFSVSEPTFAALGPQRYSTGIYDVYLAAAPPANGTVRYTLRDALDSSGRANLALLLAVGGVGLMGFGLLGWLRLKRP